MSSAIATAGAVGIVLLVLHIVFRPVLGPLARVPGPKSFIFTKWRLAYEDYKGSRTRTIHSLHERYGPVVRIGPNEVSFNSTSAVRTIYGAGSGFERTSFYGMFEVYGRQNMFTFSTPREHAQRKKMLAHAYAKSTVLKGGNATMIENKVRLFLELIERDRNAGEIFSSLHFFSLDTITEFLYGGFGQTSCLQGVEKDRALLGDIIDTSRRRLSWFSVHFPHFTEWLYSRVGILGYITPHFYPMAKPTTYTGIRRHAMNATCEFASAAAAKTDISNETMGSPLVLKLWKHYRSQKSGSTLDDVDIASECADHLLAGVDTTSDTLMFLIWSLSRPEARRFQEKLIEEVRTIPEENLNASGLPRVDASDKLLYVNAVIKETLRLFAPLPGSEPRSAPIISTIDGYVIPAKTIVSVSPYTLHRNPDVFPNPLDFNPDRWIGSPESKVEMNRWFWAFSSGARACIGLHLAMAEMTTLVAAIYRKYTTVTTKGFDVISPGITSRYEVFYDEACDAVREHQCEIKFQLLNE
ncbi:cytochrome protein [Thozetella sp. PMI_491]|nr:cytochrome protein [Thozetella sp. PMI_491]